MAMASRTSYVFQSTKGGNVTLGFSQEKPGAPIMASVFVGETATPRFSFEVSTAEFETMAETWEEK